MIFAGRTALSGAESPERILYAIDQGAGADWPRLIELERTSDPVRLSVLRSVLTDAEIDHYVFDAGAGNLRQGAIPLRLMVRDDDRELAQRAIAHAGL